MLVVLDHFDATRALDCIERYRVNFMFSVPTMLLRMLREDHDRPRDLASIETILHAGASCPAWLKRAWIDRVGPEHIWEAYGASENTGFALIRGDDWLRHPGSVGRPFRSQVKILDGKGVAVRPGEVGEIFMRRERARHPPYAYIGSPPATETEDGFVSVGDLGRMDEEGYLYMADRRVDMIISGGANVFPAEVEACLVEHKAVADAIVIGLRDNEWGRRVHAIIQPTCQADLPSFEELVLHCKDRLAPYKIPKSFEIVAQIPRDENLKVRRSALTAEREKRGTEETLDPGR